MHILLVEDNPGDVRLVQECFRGSDWSPRITVAEDGILALEFLDSGEDRPDLMILDLNLPRRSGREVLELVKESEEHRTIPVIVLTTSEAEADVQNCYRLYANCFITKPMEFEDYQKAVKIIEQFWLGLVRLPGRQ